MSDYWSRQRAKAKEAHTAPRQGIPAGQAYYQPAFGKQEDYAPVQPFQGYGNGPQPDFSQADHLRQGDNQCPNCPPDPKTGIRGNMFRASQNSVMRCFNCGAIAGEREIHDPSSRQSRGRGTGAEGPVQRAKQTVAGGSTGHNYQGFSNAGRPVEGIDH